VLISGVVQSVGFRMSTWQAAQKLGALQGYVRNLPDGRVEAVFAGDEEAVLWMSAWCKTGPQSARVSHIEVIEETYDSTLPVFQIQR
jgi:acylphosphatase